MLNEERQGKFSDTLFSQLGSPYLLFSVGTLTAIDARSKLEIAQVQRRYQCQQRDILNAKWADNSTIYIPVSAEGVVIRWNIRDASVQDNHLLDITVRTEDPVVIRPLASITRHSILKFAITKDKAWWTATGITLSNPPSGLIEVHDVENDESRIVEGLVSCIVEVDVYDKEKALLVSADVTLDSRLRFCVQQLNPSDSGQSFIPVDMKVDLLEENDYPRDIVVLHPLPIVAVMTEEFYSYFFELHTGAYLFSQSQRPYRLCPGRSDRRGLLIWSHEKSEVEALTVNEGDLIGYCRQVLGNDILASTIAVRTGLPGAEDVVLNDMYGQYRDISSRRAG
ncbi:hypothetical protein FRC03_003507 [Tulasnella sp. 419]|nr:hypothetical protein FRC03_003507 [Tulasnella sp. 419]